VRFSTLGLQSYWYNEAATVLMVKSSFGRMLDLIVDQEGNPPLYYLLAWAWAKVFGPSELGLRSLSALAGTAMVPAAWWALRRDAGERAALVYGGLTAVAPLLVWYSQEARPYILVALLVTVGAGFFLRALARPGDRAPLLAWAGVSVLAGLTHYFAFFVIAPQGLILLRRRTDRGRVVACGAVLVATLAALVPLIDQQRELAKTSIIGDFGTRVQQLPKQLLIAFDAPLETALGLAAILLAVAAAAAAIRAEPRARRAAALLGGLGVGAVLLALLLAVLGTDYVNTRNLIVALPLLLAPVAIGLTAPISLGPRVALAAGFVAVLCTAWMSVNLTPKFQRDDWRAVGKAIGPADQARIVIVSPGQAYLPMLHYRPDAKLLRPGSALRTREILVIGLAKRQESGGDPIAPDPRTAMPYPGFQPVEVVRNGEYTLIRMRAAKPVDVQQIALGQVGLGLGQIAYVQRP
jgi:mannosyltransferase